MDARPSAATPPSATAPVLLTPYVFIDTSVFWRSNFNWKSIPFAALQRLCASGKLKLLITDIVRREMDAHLAKKLETARDELKRARKVGSILLQVDAERFGPMFATIDEAAALKLLRGHRDAYFAACLVWELDAYAVSAQEVFDAYFAGAPPFGGADKKAEFPDAYNLAALRAWAAATGERAYVVSGDTDLRAACADDGDLIWVDRIETVIAAAQAEADFAVEVQAAVERLRPRLRDFLDVAFPKLSFVLTGQSGDVTEVGIVKIDVQEAILDEWNDNWSAVEATVRVTFRGIADIDDMVTANWDNETKEKVPWRRVQEAFLEMCDVVLELQLLRRAPGDFELLRRSIAQPDVVYVTV